MESERGIVDPGLPGTPTRPGTLLPQGAIVFVALLLVVAVLTLGARLLESHRKVYSTIAAAVFAALSAVFALWTMLQPKKGGEAGPQFSSACASVSKTTTGFAALLAVSAIAHLVVALMDFPNEFGGIFTAGMNVFFALILLILMAAPTPKGGRT